MQQVTRAAFRYSIARRVRKRRRFHLAARSIQSCFRAHRYRIESTAAAKILPLIKVHLCKIHLRNWHQMQAWARELLMRFLRISLRQVRKRLRAYDTVRRAAHAHVRRLYARKLRFIEYVNQKNAVRRIERRYINNVLAERRLIVRVFNVFAA